MPDDGGLERLIATETRLAARLTEAEVAATAIVEEARQAVALGATGYAAELAVELERLAGRAAEARTAEVGRIGLAAAERVRRYQGITAATTDALAAAAVTRLFAEWRGGAT